MHHCNMGESYAERMVPGRGFFILFFFYININAFVDFASPLLLTEILFAILVHARLFV